MVDFAVTARPEPWPSAKSVARSKWVYHWIAVAAAVPVLGLLKLEHYILAATFAGAALLALAGRALAAGFISGYKEAARHAAEDARWAAAAEPCLEEIVYTPATDLTHGYLYVIRFSTGVVKVGRTNDPSRRVPEHQRDAWTYNVVITDAWISEPHADYLSNEVRLIAFATSRGSRARREYFHGADFERLAEFARDLIG